jgi:hypothetical protein
MGQQDEENRDHYKKSCSCLGSVKARATETASTQPYSGDLWSRSTFTGDWGGFCNEWAQKGITFDFSITQVGQGVVNGGQERRLAVRRAGRHGNKSR